MEESLKAWIELACRDILNVHDADCNLFEDNLFTVGKHILHEPNCSFEQLRQKGAQTLNLREDDTSLFATATILLKYAVSSECNHKSEYVSHIISMDNDIQENLMAVIQDQSLVILDDDTDESFDNDCNVVEDSSTLQNESFSSPQRSHTTSDWMNEPCDNCHKIEKDLLNHTKQIDDLLKRERDLEVKMKEENTVFMNQNMDMQDTLRERDSRLQELTLLLREGKDRESAMASRVEDCEQLRAQVGSLQDEVDLLQPLVKRAESAESQLSRMHEKLDKLDGVKDQLKAEAEAHNVSQTELLALQVEVEVLRKTKTQVVEYRDRCAENAITIGDLNSQLVSCQEEVRALRARLEQESEGHQATEHYSKSLVDELKVASEALRNSEREGGIGGGISELNPEVSKELNRLRVENAELKSKVDLSSVESLDRLQQDLSDQSCINTSLQQKWTKAKEDIEALIGENTELKDSVAEWRGLHERLQHEHDRAMEIAEQEKECAAILFQTQLAHATQRMEDSQFILSRGQRAVTEGLQEEYNATFATLSQTEGSLSAMTSLKNTLVAEVEAKNECLEIECKKRKRCEEEFEEEKERMRLSFDHDKVALVDKQERDEQALKQKYKLQIDMERSKNLNLAADIEEEKLKRRKLDREKRFHESESHRYKSQMQMQANSSDSNVEVESALKEMKSMQNQLDAAKKQIALLQSQNRDASSTTCLDETGPSDNSKPSTRRTLGNSAQRVNHRGDNLSSYVEQTDMYERRIEQMTRERREMIAKNLAENKERLELNQRLLQSEKETAGHKARVTKLTLEKERLARRLAKQADQQENVPVVNGVSML